MPENDNDIDKGPTEKISKSHIKRIDEDLTNIKDPDMTNVQNNSKDSTLAHPDIAEIPTTPKIEDDLESKVKKEIKEYDVSEIPKPEEELEQDTLFLRKARRQSAKRLRAVKSARRKTIYLAPGDHIADNTIVQQMAQGGMGVVYEAVDEKTKQDVVIKTMIPDLTKDKDLVRRFKRESRLLYDICHKDEKFMPHPNIVSVMDYGFRKSDGGLIPRDDSIKLENLEGLHFYVMERLEGKSLEDLITERNTIPKKTAAKIIRHAAAALDYILKQPGMRNFVHRDLKPDNIWIGKTIKLMDFGTARGADLTGYTQTGHTLGTVKYMSPEQAAGSKGIDSRSDIFALGSILYQLVTGHVPFDFESDNDNLRIRGTMEKIKFANPIPIEDTKLLRDNYFLNMLYKMLAKDPLDRYQNPAELMSDLELYIKTGKTKGKVSEWSRYKNQLRWWAKNIPQWKKLTAASLSALLVVGGIGYGGYRVHRHNQYTKTIEYFMEQNTDINALYEKPELTTADYERLSKFFDGLLEKIAERKIYPLIDENSDRKIPEGKYPYTIGEENNTWFCESAKKWTGGLFSGNIWSCYEEVDDPDLKEEFRKYARIVTKGLDVDVNVMSDNNLLLWGLRSYTSFVRGFELEQGLDKEYYREKALESTDTLLERILKKSRKSTIIKSVADHAANLPFLCWSYGQTNDDELKNIILDYTQRYFNHISGDSIPRIVYIKNNKVIKTENLWGKKKGTRSLNPSILLYGLVEVYDTFKDDPDFQKLDLLSNLEKIANYMIENLPADHVPYWDWTVSEGPKDSSAASWGAYSLLRLAEVHPDKDKAKEYFKISSEILISLKSDSYFSEKEDHDGILLHACRDYPNDIDLNNSMIYGDYFFIESIKKFREIYNKFDSK